MALITISYPESGLSPSISIVNIETEEVDFSGTMIEVLTTKGYTFSFTAVEGDSYVYTITTAGYSDYVDFILYGSSLTTAEHTKLFSLENYGGGGIINYQAINNHTTKKINELKEQMPDYTEKLYEIDSHIELAKEQTIDTIKEVEIEVCSDIIRKTNEVKEDNITTRNLVRQKTKKIGEGISKLTNRQDLTDKMIESEADEIETSLEKIYNKEAEMIENEIKTQYEKEADIIESEINQ